MMPRAVRTERIGLRTTPFLERLSGRRMVGMGVGDENVRDRLAIQRPFQRLEMLGQEGARIDDGDLAATDNVDAGALEGEGTRIARQHPRDERSELDVLAV